MIEDWALWLLLVGLAVGASVMGVLLVRLPRADDDVGTDERQAEAAWIAGTIERHGGIAPTSLVEEVLDLHTAYLRLQRPPAPTSGPMTAPPVPPLEPPHAPATAPGGPPAVGLRGGRPAGIPPGGPPPDGPTTTAPGYPPAPPPGAPRG